MTWHLYDIRIGDRVVYVGITKNIAQRKDLHRHRRRFRGAWSMYLVGVYDSEKAARCCEAARIAELSPRYNSLCRRDPKRPPVGKKKLWDKEKARVLLVRGWSANQVARRLGIDSSTMTGVFVRGDDGSVNYRV